MKRLSLLLTIFVLEGCVGPGPIQKDYTLQQKKIAVVSELGNNFHRNIVGTTVFSNKMTRTDVTSWEINHQAARHLVERLSKQGLTGTEVNSDLFTPLDGSSPYTISTIPDKVIAKVKPLGYDSLLLIAPVISELYPFFDPGYGLKTGYFFGSPNTCVYTVFIVHLYDLHTGKEVGWEWMNAQRGPCEPKSSNDLAVKDSLDDYSAQEKQEIRSRIEKRVIDSLDATINKMELFH